MSGSYEMDPPPGQPGSQPYGQQPYGPPQHGQAQFGPPPYGQAPYAQPPYAQPPYGQQPGPYGPPNYAPQQYGPPPGADPTDCVGARVGQYILDGLVAGVVVLVVFLVFGLLGYLTGSSAIFAVLYLLGIVVAIAAPWFVLAYWPSTHQGRTPAMGWLGLRIVDEQTGGVPTLGALTLRWLLLIVDGLFGGLVGLIIMSSQDRHQRLGDMVAKTLVVRA